MGYKRAVTETIVHCWGKGLSASETVTWIKEKLNLDVGIATVYRHRHSLTAKDIIEELMREQRRDIALCQSDATRMKYRDKLLKKLIPELITMKADLNVNGLNESINTLIKFSQDEPDES